MVRFADRLTDALLPPAKEPANSEGRAPAGWPYCTALKLELNFITPPPTRRIGNNAICYIIRNDFRSISRGEARAAAVVPARCSIALEV